MVNRVCISINNQCNLNCRYCHFHEKTTYIREDKMNVFVILDNIIEYMETNDIPVFKIGFVGNGEPLLNYQQLKEYIVYIKDYLCSGRIVAYTITNGTLITKEMLKFFKDYGVRIGFSIDGLEAIHNKYRCGTFKAVMEGIELYQDVYGEYPSLNCTVGKEILEKSDETINFFKMFSSRITFSRMIGKYEISLCEFNEFLAKAEKQLEVRRGGLDCTMYGGYCGAGINNYFFSNGKVFLCGNCVDLPSIGNSDSAIASIETKMIEFDRKCCYKETVCG